ncbi:MAG: DUF2788 domain-containing protein [Halopseudomonas sp.]|uniref:DUF2788 domain-containing protein n=1 Tax=Halopseudomonas sp. TaxID=2901191 RepID=UPI003002E011
MTYDQFEAIAMPLMILGLVAFMGFIIWDLAKKSKAGRYGTAVLFSVLGLGVFAFVIKEVAIAFIG